MNSKKYFSLLLALVLMFSLTMSGCQQSPKDNGGQKAESEKVLRYSYPTSPADFDPINLNELYAYHVVRLMYNGLTDRTPEGKLKPGLAESWETEDAGKTYHFNLKKGVKFHSGKELTAKDVKATFETILNPEKSGDGHPYLSNIVGATEIEEGKSTDLVGFKILGDYEFEIEQVEPDVYLPMSFSVEPLSIVDIEAIEGKGENWWETMSAGTGAFKLKSYERDKKITFAANPEYWRGRPQIDQVEIHIVPSQDTALAMYESGQLDMVDVPAEQIDRVREDKELSQQLYDIPVARLVYIGFNQDVYPAFKDAKVREAINLVVDREKMVKTIMNDTAYPLYGAIPVGFSCWDENLPKIAYDPEKARQLLAEAGYNENNPLPPVTFYCYPDPMEGKVGTYVASQMKRELGMEVEVKQVERAKILEDLRAHKLPIFISGNTADYGDARTQLYWVFSTGGGMNFMNYSNSEFDGLLDKATEIAEPAERDKIYLEAERILLDDWAFGPLYTKKFFTLIKPYVKDVPLSCLGMDTFENVKIER